MRQSGKYKHEHEYFQCTYTLLANHIDLVTKKNTDNKQLVCMLCNEPPEVSKKPGSMSAYCLFTVFYLIRTR